MELNRITRFELNEAVDFLDRNFHFIHHVDLLIQLGSGQDAKGLLDDVWGSCPLLDMPQMPDEPTMAKHDMMIHWGTVGDIRVLIYSGRFHYYEGFGRKPVLLPIWAAVECGARNVLLTNAAGGIAEGLEPGAFMMIRDHVNNLGVSALAGHQNLLRTAYVDMSDVYDQKMSSSLMEAARNEGLRMLPGTYWANVGPQFETPAETELAHQLGASAVGMSTVLEATLAHALGARVAAISMITNRASGLSQSKLSHDETLACGRTSGINLIKLLRRWLTHQGKGLL